MSQEDRAHFDLMSGNVEAAALAARCAARKEETAMFERYEHEMREPQ